MARGKLITEEQELKMIEMAKRGIPISQIANKIGCSGFAVEKRVRGHVPADRKYCKRITKDDIKGMRKMRSNGVKHHDISEKYCCSVYTVFRYVKDIKVETKKAVILKALRTGGDLDKLVKRNGYDRTYVNSVIDLYRTTGGEIGEKCEEREIEVMKQRLLLEEKAQLRAKELEELRQQEIREFRWGGTFKIC